MTKFIMVIGLPGSGKDTWIKDFLNGSDEPFEVFSSDEIRGELYGDESTQGNPAQVFEIMNKRARGALLMGKNVVYNATNLEVRYRDSIMSLIEPMKDVMKYAVIIATTYEQCLVNNRKRRDEGGRFVPEEVIKKMYYHYEPPHYFEGFNRIEVAYPFIKPYIIPMDVVKRLRKMPHDNPHHHLSVGAHIKATARAAEADIKKGMHIGFDENDAYKDYYTSLVPKVLWLHDLGKEKTKVFANRKGEPTKDAHYWNHQNVGSYDYMFYTTKEGYDPTKITYDPNVAAAICYHDRPFSWEKEETHEKYRKLWGIRLYNLVMKVHYYDDLPELK